MSKPESLILEGGDGVGKNFLALALIRHLIANELGVIFTNFPQYWFFGDYIRSMNSSQSVREALSQLDGFREAEVRAAMYALDRVFGLNSILSHKESNPDAVIVSDRGPLSNVVTGGVMWSQGKLSDETIENFLTEVVGKIDQEMMDYLNPLSILCRNTNLEGKAALHREQLDFYEAPKPQEYAAMAYEKMNLPTIYTADADGWRNANTLTQEVMSYSNIDTDLSLMGEDVDIQNSVDNGQLQVVGPYDLTANAIGLIPLSPTLINFWQNASLLPESDLIQRGIIVPGDPLKGDRKTLLNTHEKPISEVLRWSVGTGLINLKLHELVRKAIRRILNAYPEILDLVLPSIQPVETNKAFISYLITLGSLES